MTPEREASERRRRTKWLERTVVAGVLLLTPAAIRAQSTPARAEPDADTTDAQAAPAAAANGGFTKITTGDIVTIPAAYQGAAWGDYDDDGYLDLFVGAALPSERNYLYHNNRDGTFTLVDEAAMPKIDSNQHGAAWGDYDNDGHLDLIVTSGNPEITRNALYHNNGDGTFTPITTGPIYDEPGQFHAPSWGDYDNDGLLDLFIAGHHSYNRLFHNDGAGSFTRVTNSVLVNEPSTSEGSQWVDYDDDGDLDLFVSNSVYGSIPNALYGNDGRGEFSKVTDSGLSGEIPTGGGGCWADYDNDGFLDVLLDNALKVSLHRNNGDGTFTDVTHDAGITDTIPPNTIFYKCAWGDYDNDGFVDLFVGNPDFALDASKQYVGPPRLRNFLYHNAGDGTFTKVTEGSIVTDLTTQSASAIWGDYDNDGFLDLFVSQGVFWPEPQTNLLYHNNGNANGWLNVKLVGTVSNRSAIGAKVRVDAFYRGERRWQLRQIFGGEDVGSEQSLNVEFGLADATIIKTLRIEWPSGVVQEFRNVIPRQFLIVTEPSRNPRPFVPNRLPELRILRSRP